MARKPAEGSPAEEAAESPAQEAAEQLSAHAKVAGRYSAPPPHVTMAEQAGTAAQPQTPAAGHLTQMSALAAPPNPMANPAAMGAAIAAKAKKSTNRSYLKG